MAVPGPAQLPPVSLYTDGACSGNPGPGGWGAILRFKGREKELSGGEDETTNNRMELTAVIRGLEALIQPCRVTVYSDSRYVVDAINRGWLDNWIARGWRKSPPKRGKTAGGHRLGRGSGQGKPVLNVDLWQQLVALVDEHEVDFQWVRGHQGHPENERADRLAVSGIPKKS